MDSQAQASLLIGLEAGLEHLEVFLLQAREK